MQRGMNAARSSEATVSLLVVPYFLLCLLYEGDYFVWKEALVQLCVGGYKSPTGSTRIADFNNNIFQSAIRVDPVRLLYLPDEISMVGSGMFNF